jgi:hypothetical protein
MDIALEESRAGEMFDYEDYEGVSKWLDSQYALYTAGVEPAIGGDISKYSRRELTRRVAEILDKITDRE